MKKRHSQYMSLFILEHFLTHTGEKPLKCDSCYTPVTKWQGRWQCVRN
jgi:hypothetical protein